MSKISEWAHVDPDAKIGNNVTIHPFAFVSKNTVIGDNCVIYPFVSVLTGSRIGKNNKIFNGSIIGAEPQDFHWHGEPTELVIGDNNIIREHTIINRSSHQGQATRIGNNCFLMAEVHVSHDAQLSDRCVIGNGVQISPEAIVHSYVILSSNCMLHSGSEVARYCMIKGGCRINGNVPPYVVIAHNPVQYVGINAVTMRHKGLPEDVIDDVAKAYRHVYESNTSVFNAVKRIKDDVRPSAARDNIVNFIVDHNMSIVASSGHSEIDY